MGANVAVQSVALTGRLRSGGPSSCHGMAADYSFGSGRGRAIACPEAPGAGRGAG